MKEEIESGIAIVQIAESNERLKEDESTSK